MKVYAENIIIELEKRNTSDFKTNDLRVVNLGTVIGVGQDVTSPVKVGTKYYFHPQNSTYINDNKWAVVNQRAIICEESETTTEY